MALMSPTDSMFLVAENREQPMHVGGLQLYRQPPGTDASFLREAYQRLVASTEVAELFRRRPKRSLTTLGQWAWEVDDSIDLEYHLRHSALPRPGRVRELLALTSRLHSTLLDRHRPLWEANLIEGLDDGRFAVYTKLHHSVMDGMTAIRFLRRSLSDSPDAPTPAPWSPEVSARRGPRRGAADAGATDGWGGGLLGMTAAAARTALDVLGTGPALARVAAQALREQALVLPMQAPRSPLNVTITGSRRYAAQSWPLPEVRAVAKAAGGTVNDVILAMCAGALRAYLDELDALPDAPLVAMTPVSLRRADDDATSGNAVGIVLVSLATDRAKAGDRLEAIQAGTQEAKATLASLSSLHIMALSALAMTPLAVSSVLPLYAVAPPPFNLVISNVPGPRETLYFNGAELLGSYPLSIPTHGQALNITVSSYRDSLDFGLTGCRRSVPHLQRLLVHLDTELGELRTAVGA